MFLAFKLMDTLIKIGNTIVPIDFIVLNTWVEHLILIILDRPFFATTRTKINVQFRYLSFDFE